jgi:hypothetical protein
MLGLQLNEPSKSSGRNEHRRDLFIFRFPTRQKIKNKNTLKCDPMKALIIISICLLMALPKALGTAASDASEAGSLPLVQSIAYAQIEEREYAINWQRDFNAYMAPNRKQNHRFTFLENGFTVTQRVFQETDPRWSATLHWDSYGRSVGQVLPAENIEWLVEGNWAEARGASASIFYNNDKEGLRQDFQIRERPQGDGPLRLDFTVQAQGLRIGVASNGQAVEFLDASGAPFMCYTNLNVFDASNNRLGATIVQTDQDSFAIIVEDAGAEYPILVDPTLLQIAYINSPQSGSDFGYTLTYCARKQGIYGGVLVGAPAYDNGSYSFAGAAFYYVIDYITLDLTTSPAWSYIGSQANERVGSSVAAGKTISPYAYQYGWNTLVVGAWGYSSGSATGRGAVYVFYPDTQGSFSSTPSWTVTGWYAGDNLGWSVASAGDVNGDGWDEILIGVPGYDSGGYSNNGAALMFSAASGGLGSSYSWMATGQGSNRAFGTSLTSGDVNGDGYDDVIVSAPGPYWSVAGSVYVYHGGTGGLPSSANYGLSRGSVGDQFGNSLASGADQDGDGYEDLLVGATHATYNSMSQAGKVYLFRGSSSGLGSTEVWTDGGTQQYEYFGTSVALGRIDSLDSLADVAIGAPYYDTTSLSLTDDGRVKAYITDVLTELPVWQVSNNGLYSGVHLGMSVSIGELLVDGENNIIAGAPNGDSHVPNVQVWEYSP